MGYTPRIQIYNHRPQPAGLPFVRDIMADDSWREAAFSPDSSEECVPRCINLQRTKASTDNLFGSQNLPGQAPRDFHALSLAYDIKFESTEATQWIQIRPEQNGNSDLEGEMRQRALAHWESEKQRLSSIGNPSDAERKQLEAAVELTKQLSPGGTGYLESVPNLFESGQSGIVWSLAEPNIPVTIRLQQHLEADRAITLRIQRLALPLDEKHGEFRLYFGNDAAEKSTCYGLVFGRDGSVEWRHYRNMAPVKRQGLENAFRDSNDEGLEGEMARDLAFQLFYDRQPVTLPEQSRGLFGRPFDVTVSWQRRGFVSVRIDSNEPWVWENKHITWMPGYHTMLPEKSSLSIQSDGGKWGLVYGHPRYAREGLLSIAPFPLDRVVPATTLTVNSDGPQTVPTENNPVKLSADANAGGPGCSIEVSLEPCPGTSMPSGEIENLPLYQLHLKVLSDGKHTPELYRCEIKVAPGVPGPLTPEWDSQEQFETYGHSPILDVQIQEDSNRAPMHEVTLSNSDGEAQLPSHLIGRVCDVSFKDESGSDETYMIWHGLIKNVEYLDQAGVVISEPGSLIPTAREVSQIRLMVSGLEDVLNTEFKASPVGNGQLPNDYIREILRNAGLREEEYSGVPEGPLPEEQLPEDQLPLLPELPLYVGKPASIKPAPGTRVLEFIQDLVEKHCIGWRFQAAPHAVDPAARGFRLTKDIYPDRPELLYSPEPSAADSLQIRQPFNFVQDISDFYTQATFIGAVNPKTGARFAATKKLYEATDATFQGSSLLYIGYEKPFLAQPDESLSSNPACDKACRAFLAKVARPPWYASLSVAFRPDIRTGDVIYIEGGEGSASISAVIERIVYGSLNSGEGQTMTLVVRIFKDLI